MEFFKTLTETGVNDVIVQFAKEENGKITVIVSPKNIIRNNPLLQIKPIILTGTPEQVDLEFSDTVVKALAVAQKLHDILEANKPKEVVKPAVSKRKAVVKTEPLTPKEVQKVMEVLDKVEIPATTTQQEQDFVAMRSPNFIPITEDDVVIERFETESVSVGEETVHLPIPPIPEEVIEAAIAEEKAWIAEGEPIVSTIVKEETLTAPELLKQAVEKLPKEEPKVIPLKTSVVNNEKHLKEFVLTLKTDADWYANEAEIERLYANLSEAELGKPYPKKVRIDLDIKLRKRAIIQAARDKMMGTTPVVEQTNPVEEQIKEGIAKGVYAEAVSEDKIENLESNLIGMPTPEAEKTYSEILADISNQQSQEPVVIPPPPPSLKYSFPVPFDSEEDSDEPYDED